MKQFLVALILALASFGASAATVVSDPLAAGVTHCGFYLDGSFAGDLPVASDGKGGNICSLDVSSISNGQHKVTATAVINDPVWGRQESDPSVPLDFVRPGRPAVPGGVRLIK